MMQALNRLMRTKTNAHMEGAVSTLLASQTPMTPIRLGQLSQVVGGDGGPDESPKGSWKPAASNLAA